MTLWTGGKKRPAEGFYKEGECTRNTTLFRGVRKNQNPKEGPLGSGSFRLL